MKLGQSTDTFDSSLLAGDRMLIAKDLFIEPYLKGFKLSL